MAIEEIIDLTQVMESNMPVYPGSRTVNLVTSATFEKQGYHEIRIDCSTHTGTHIDCGYHLLDGGLNTITTPISQFYGKGLVVDCRHIAPDGLISKEFLQPLGGEIIKAAFILLHTGWNRYWGTEEYFGKFPVLHADAAAYLSSFNLKGIGSDTISFDPIDSKELPVHHILLSKGLILIENLVNLHRIPPQEFTFSCFPLKIKNGDGSPVRAAAIVTSDK